MASLAAADSFAMPVVPPSFSVRAIASGLGVFPQALDVTGDGTIYVADFYGSVFRVTPTGQVFPLSGPFSNQLLQGVVVRDSNDVFVSSTDSVFRLAPGASAFSVFSHNPSRFNAQDIRGDLALRGTSLFMVGQGGSFPPLWNVDATTGTFAAFETSPVGDFTAVAFDPRADVLVGAGLSGLFEINPETGSAKMFSFSAPGEPVTRTVFDCETGQSVTVTINPSRSVGQATVHPVTGDVYFTTLGSHEIMRATRDGKVSVFSPFGFDTMGGNLETSIGIGFDDAGEHLYVTDRGTLYEISGDFVSIPCSVVYAFNEVTTSVCAVLRNPTTIIGLDTGLASSSSKSGTRMSSLTSSPTERTCAGAAPIPHHLDDRRAAVVPPRVREQRLVKTKLRLAQARPNGLSTCNHASDLIGSNDRGGRVTT